MDVGGALSKQGPCLDTVRALHQTVVALRAALEQSRSEILELKSKHYPVDSVEQTLRALTLENHVLKTKLVDEQAQKPVLEETRDNPLVHNEEKKLETTRTKSRKKKGKFEAKISIKSIGKASASLESLLVLKSPTAKKLSVSKTVSFSNLTTLGDISTKNLSASKTVSFSNINTLPSETEMNSNNNNETRDEEPVPQNDLEQDQDQEVDDIELIFTTDETKDSDFKEQLVSIEPGDSHADTGNLLQCPDLDQNLDVSDRELDDDVFNDNTDVDFRRENSQLYNSKSDNSINQEKSLKSCYSYQDSSFENKSLEKDESFDRFEERVRIIETDISKCGIQDPEYGGLRRNTCPNPLSYRPLIHRYIYQGFVDFDIYMSVHDREALAKGSRKTRPILAHSNAIRKDSGAQTDISALPGSSWLSESNLVNKVRDLLRLFAF